MARPHVTKNDFETRNCSAEELLERLLAAIQPAVTATVQDATTWRQAWLREETLKLNYMIMTAVSF